MTITPELAPAASSCAPGAPLCEELNTSTFGDIVRLVAYIHQNISMFGPQALASSLALLAHQTLGCRGASRVDFRYDDTSKGAAKLFILEINTQPGMTPKSLLPEIAAEAGISYDELVQWMVEEAACDS